MDRDFLRHVSRWTFFALCAAIVSSGCALLPTVAWMVTDGNDVPAEYTLNGGLEGKRVVVVCFATGPSTFQHVHTPPKLAEAVGKLLKQNVHKIVIVDPREVADWTDNNQNQDYAEIGRFFKADVVVGIDLDDFRLQDGQTLYHGKAVITLRVHDLKNADSGEAAWNKSIPQAEYPAFGPVAATGNLAQFRREFIRVLADQIARHFYDHDSSANFALARVR